MSNQQQQQQQQMSLPTMVEPVGRSRNNSLGDISLESLNDVASISSSFDPEEQGVTQHLLPPQNNESTCIQGGPVVVVMQGESQSDDVNTHHPLNPSGSNNLPSESASLRLSSLSRRRSASNRSRPPSGFVPSLVTASSSSTVTTASSSSLILQRANNSTRSETIDEEGQGGCSQTEACYDYDDYCSDEARTQMEEEAEFSIEDFFECKEIDIWGGDDDNG